MDAERDAIKGPAPRPRIVSADGGLMHGARAMIEEQLKALDSDGALARHLKVVSAITGAPLVVGNSTDILIDGPNAYASIFAAIRAATDHIHIERFIFEHRDALLHAKTAVIDGVWSTIGSSNIDWRSFCHNDEVNAIVVGDSFGTEMTRVFNDDLAAAVEVTAADWAQRGAADRLREWLARRWDQWL